MKTVCIIVTYNDENEAIRHLKLVRDFDCLDRIIVVDNASEPASIIRLLSYIKHDESGKLELIKLSKNGGYGAGNNAGLARAAELGAEYALIANPDVQYSESTVSRLVGIMDKHDELAAAAPVMVMLEAKGVQKKPGTYPNTILAPVAWPLRSWWKELLEMGPVSRRLFQKILHYPEDYYKIKPGSGSLGKAGTQDCVYVDAVPGSLLLVDVAKVRGVGGYDEEMFLYGEENLLAFKLKKAGFKTALCLKESYIHCHRGEMPSMKSQLEREKSMKYYMRKYLGTGDRQEKTADLLFSAIHAEMELRKKLAVKAAAPKQGQSGWAAGRKR